MHRWYWGWMCNVMYKDVFEVDLVYPTKQASMKGEEEFNRHWLPSMVTWYEWIWQNLIKGSFKA